MLESSRRYYLYDQPVDMRKGIDGYQGVLRTDGNASYLSIDIAPPVVQLYTTRRSGNRHQPTRK
ncbi:MAG: hypothetical protein KDC53_07875 [Saprospiraceae bacterium]|nr:hypothetical protein [Saprospiraceae bacterium]